MARTNATAVGKIIEVDAGADLTPFIEAANEMVTEACAPLGYTDTRLELIERWLSAHYYAVFEPRSAQSSLDGGAISDTFEGRTAMGLDFTRYGQQAKLLDTKGGLASIENKQKTATLQKVSATWLGTEETTE